MEALTWKTRIAVLWIGAAVAMSAHMVLMILDPAALQLAAKWAATAGTGGWVFTAVFWLLAIVNLITLPVLWRLFKKAPEIANRGK